MSVKDWPPVFNHPAPSIDPTLQKQLEEIGGRVMDGRPKLRLVWGQSPEASIFWEGRRRLRYLFKTERKFIGWKAYELSGIKIYPPSYKPPETDALIVERIWEEEDIGIPRWFVEQIMPPEVLGMDWDRLRYDLDSDSGELKDSLGPLPQEGDYEEAFYMIASHENCCPNNEFRVGCKGEYREPEQYDIEYVRWLMKQLNEEPLRYDWQSIPPPQSVVQSLLDRKTAALHLRLKKMEETEYGIKNSILSLKGKTFGVRPVTIPDLKGVFEGARKF